MQLKIPSDFGACLGIGLVLIFESKGESWIFCNSEKQVIVPQEFHFGIDRQRATAWKAWSLMVFEKHEDYKVQTECHLFSFFASHSVYVSTKLMSSDCSNTEIDRLLNY
ncbi:unnamed protein product, partial [Linum tenue]